MINKQVARISVVGIVACLFAMLFMLSPASTSSARAATTDSSGSKVIDVNLTQQKLTASEGGKVVYSTLVLTGRAGLETPIGTYHVFAKESPTTFYSPWPASSPNYYEPTHINYALEWKPGGYYLHDSWWHSVYGPGTNGWHNDPTYGRQNGSHGCISMPYAAAQWLYNWAPIGTTVQIHS
ncbi:L,D-transpeptidase [Dictyobacter aurantiacus]|uniref:L,D-TPase catalytic domain-containing protein n=1 Tax=Dictyobacter aurantiacus TaxID=1936993 RepID=A0A401ZPR9_9CHLR|nr:L,D-transpeptidase [Dictyobacter aurantiacus]GCE08784.1 hypothetical protein KDAU_61130 [Dictyobacter aurantiacus]